MDSITRNTTPTITLTSMGDIPEGATPRVSVWQDNTSFTPDLKFIQETGTTMFTLTREQTSSLVAGSSVFIQQSMEFPDGTVETFPVHMLPVMEYLTPNPVDEEDLSEVVPILSTDTEVVEDTVYMVEGYSLFDPIDGVPMDLGLYEVADGEIVPTQDLSFDPDKEYYQSGLVPVEPEGNENPSALGWYTMEDPVTAVEEPDEPELETRYEVVEPEEGDNPSELGWLVENDMGLYVITSDTAVVSGRTYYTVAADDYIDNIDAMIAEMDIEGFIARHGLESVDGEDLSEGSDDEEWYVDSDDTGGMVILEV